MFSWPGPPLTDILIPVPGIPGCDSEREGRGRGRGCGNGKDSRNVGWLLSGAADGEPSVGNIWDWEQSLVPSQHWELSPCRGLLWQENLKWILQSSQIVWAWRQLESGDTLNLMRECWSMWHDLFRFPYLKIKIYGIFLGILHYLFLMCLILMTPNPSFSFLHGSPPIGENQNSWSMITLRTHDLGPGEYNLWKVPAEGETIPWLSNLHLMLTNKVSLRTLCWVPRLGWRLWSLTNSWHSSASHYSQMAARGHKVNRGMFYLKHNLVDENMKSWIDQLLNNGCNIICDCWPAALTPSVCTGNLWPSPPLPLHNKPHNNKSSRENITTQTYHQQPDIFKSSLGLENFACLSATQEEIEKVTNSSILKLGVCIIC